MFTAYSVGVTVHLQNRVSEALRLIGRDLALTGAQARAFQRQLENIRLNFTKGMILGGVGFLGLEAVKAAVKPAMEYAHQLNIMNNLGMTQKEIAEAVGVAWKNTGTVITTTATGNLRTLVDLRNLLADKTQMAAAGRTGAIDMKMAYDMLPTLTRLQAVLTASTLPGVASIGKDDRFIYEMAKTLDIRGAATDPVRFAREADLMARAMVGMQGRITPESFKQAMIFARQEKFQLSDQFMYERGLPTLMLEQAGSSGGAGGARGVGPMLAALNRYFVQDIHTKQAIVEGQKIGILDSRGKSKYAELALTDPYALAIEKVLPGVMKFLGPKATEAQISVELGKVFRGNQGLADIMMRFIHQQANILRDQQVIAKVLPMGTAYQQSLMKDPTLAFAALEAQWTNLKNVFGTAVIPILIPTIMTLAEALQNFSAYARESPVLVRNLTYAFTGLSAALMFSGAVYTLRAAFAGLMVFADVTAGIVGLRLALAALLAGPLGFFLGFKPSPTQGPEVDYPGGMKGTRLNTSDWRPSKYGDPVVGIINPWKTGPVTPPPPLASPNLAFGPPTGPTFGPQRTADELANIRRSNEEIRAGGKPPSMVSGDMRERNAIPELTNILTSNARERTAQDQSFLARLGAIIKEGLAAGLAGVTINLDGATVGRMMEERANRRLSDPPRGGGGMDTRIMPEFPAIVN